jgi:copper homeostasis protein
MTVVLELCTEDAGVLLDAANAGADRAELCSALPLGGLTPSYGQMERAAKAAIPVHAMIRPRPGDFIYSESELDIMAADIHVAAKAGMAGVVFGATRADFMPDTRVLAELLAHVHRASADHGRQMAAVFHRAIDLSPDILAASDAVCDLGFSHILSSGGAPSAHAGRGMLKQLRERTAGRCTVIAGAGIRHEIAGEIAKFTGIREFHATCRPLDQGAPSGNAERFGFGNNPNPAAPLGELRLLKSALTEPESGHSGLDEHV